MSRQSVQTNRLGRREYKCKIGVKNIRKNSCMIRNQLKIGSESGSEYNHSESTTQGYLPPNLQNCGN
jgi:hypothetical protein